MIGKRMVGKRGRGKKYIGLFLCLALVFQMEAVALGEELMVPMEAALGEELMVPMEEESQTADLYAEERSSAEEWPDDLLIEENEGNPVQQTGNVSENLSGAGDTLDSEPESALEDLSGMEENPVSESEEASENSSEAEENPVPEPEEVSGNLSETEENSLSEPESILEEELTGDPEGLLEDLEDEELQEFSFTETVELEDPFVASGNGLSMNSRMFRMVAQYDGCFGHQLSGTARTFYDARVDYYVTKHQIGQMSLDDYIGNNNPYVFKAELDQTGKQVKETEECKAVKQQLLFDLQSSLDAFVYDHPEIFWLRGGKVVYMVSTVGSPSKGYVGFLSKIVYTPTIAFSGATSLISQYDAAVSKVVSQIQAEADKNGDRDLEPMELIMTAHDYLCRRFYYDHAAYDHYETTQDYRIFCSAGAFLDSVGSGVVCEGYAKAFKVICDRLGIPCVLIGGFVVQSGKTEGHMWNGVQLNGKWYLMDVTWDDNGTEPGYNYFMVGNNLPGRTSSGNFGGADLCTIFVYPQLEMTDLFYCDRLHSYCNGICSRCGTGDTIVNATVSSISSQAYGGKTLTPGVTVKFGSNVLTQGRDYTLTYRNNVKLGTAYVTVTGKGIYRGTVSRAFQIVKKSVTALTFSAVKDRAYTGKSQKPSVTITNNGVKLVKNKDYTISYSKNKSIGKAQITIKGKGSYTGTKKLSFSIVPKAPTFSKLKSSSRGKLTATWKRVSGVTGYQIQYSLKSNFSGAKSVTAGASTSSKTISKLKKGKRYYVRVRSYKKVSGKKYYSAWSKTRKVTVKKK